jgi:hypothetical protein
MKRYKWTITGFVLMLILWGCSAKFNLDVFESLAAFLNRFEHVELDELLLPVLVLYTFTLADLSRRHDALRIEAEKLKIYRKMVSAVCHIMNNFLQKMLAFKLAAENTKDFDPEALKLYDLTIKDAAEQIKVLGSLERPDEDLIDKAIQPVKNGIRVPG